MDWQDELSPVKNWQGWLGAIILVFVLGILPGLLGDGQEGLAAREAMKEHAR